MSVFSLILAAIAAALPMSCAARGSAALNEALNGAEPAPVYEVPAGYSDRIAPYVEFLEGGAVEDPVDYVMGLFERFDIVVLCERDHRDITQYDLLYSIVSDERFLEVSGTVCTEIGSQTINDRLNEFLLAQDLDEAEIDERLVGLYRDMEWMGRWEKYNTYDFWKRIHRLNTTLGEDRKVRSFCTDFPIDWNGMTGERYEAEITERLGLRDRIMADFTAATYRNLAENPGANSGRTKLLVVMNYRHAFVGLAGNTADYLAREFPGRVANVMINAVRLAPGSTDRDLVTAPVHDGAWDAAFRYCGNPSVGFDFAGTPFGSDRFDYFEFIEHDLTYQDVFTGFVFYRPLEEHLFVWNIPGFMDRGFFPEYRRRLAIADESIREIQLPYFILRPACNRMRSARYADLPEYNRAIEAWLEY